MHPYPPLDSALSLSFQRPRSAVTVRQACARQRKTVFHVAQGASTHSLAEIPPANLVRVECMPSKFVTLCLFTCTCTEVY